MSELNIHIMRMSDPSFFPFDKEPLEATKELFRIIGETTLCFIEDEPDKKHMVVVQVPMYGENYED